MNKWQKGQDLVEFALILPVFMVILCGIVYVGFFFGDYMTLSNITRSAAREAAVSTATVSVNENGQTVKRRDFHTITDKYNNILKNEHIITSLYLFQNTDSPLAIQSSTLPQETNAQEKTAVKAEIPMVINKGQGFVNALYNLGIISDSNANYTITYYMYDENPVGSSQ